jgi:serine/threonine protein kinase
MLNLTGVYIKEMPQVHFMTYNFYCFKLISPYKSRLFYVENKEDYDGWIINLKKVINYSDINEIYSFSDKLEKGKFGPIKKGFNKKTKKQVVISLFAKKYMSQSDFEQITNQIQILKIAKHPNIGKLIDVYETTDFIYLISEYYPGLDLFDYFEKRNFQLKEKNVARIIQQLCSVIYFLGEYGIIHRDLKLENILMTNETDNADIKILDFFSAVFISPKYYQNEIIGSISYASPEILENKPWDQKTDLWSLGIITYFLLTGFLPFEDENNDERNVARKIIKLPVSYPENIWKNISYIAKDFVENLLQKNPENRMNIKQCLEHPWIQTNCETPLSSFGCKIRRNKKKKFKTIPGGVIFKMYSSPSVKYMSLGNQDEQKKFLIFNNNNNKGNRIKIINKHRKKIGSVKITTYIQPKNNLIKNFECSINNKICEEEKTNKNDKNSLLKNL